MKVRRYVEGKGEDARIVEIIEFKFWDKQTATDQITRHFGYYKPTKFQDVPVDLSQASEEQLERIANGEDPAVVMATPSSRGHAPTAQDTKSTVHLAA